MREKNVPLDTLEVKGEHPESVEVPANARFCVQRPFNRLPSNQWDTSWSSSLVKVFERM